MSFLTILAESHKDHLVYEILEYIQQSLNGHESNGIMTRVSSFKVKYYLDTEQTEKLNQELYTYWNTARRLQKQTNEAIISLINAQRDLEASQRSNEKLKELADTDSLTSLPNRRAMNEKLDQMLELAYHKKHYLAVEMLDVDNFKHVNDTYGHSTGDDVLVLLGKCLKEISSDRIYAARYGGDEFVIAYDDLSDEEITKTAMKLKELLRTGIESVSLPVFTISQGAVAAIPQDDVKVWDYTSTADSALYTTKRKGKNDFLLVHSPSELQRINEALFPKETK
jgi:diguanylate cyclase (GGDEF)-like protein